MILRVFIFSLILSVHQARGAGGAFLIDDAGIVEKGEFELQTWIRQGSSSYQETTIAPAFQVVDNLELTFEGVFEKLQKQEANTRLSTFNIEAKFLSPFKNDLFDYGLVLATSYSSGKVSEYYGYIPVTYGLNSLLSMHVNLGASYDRVEKESEWFWAVGPEFSLTDRTQLVGSIFGGDEGRSGYELGVRSNLIPENLEIEIIYAKDAFANSDDLFTLGLVWFL